MMIPVSCASDREEPTLSSARSPLTGGECIFHTSRTEGVGGGGGTEVAGGGWRRWSSGGGMVMQTKLIDFWCGNLFFLTLTLFASSPHTCEKFRASGLCCCSTVVFFSIW